MKTFAMALFFAFVSSFCAGACINPDEPKNTGGGGGSPSFNATAQILLDFHEAKNYSFTCVGEARSNDDVCMVRATTATEKTTCTTTRETAEACCYYDVAIIANYAPERVCGARVFEPHPLDQRGTCTPGADMSDSDGDTVPNFIEFLQGSSPCTGQTFPGVKDRDLLQDFAVEILGQAGIDVESSPRSL